MKIGEIRDVIRTARWVRSDLCGGTSEEFKRQDVGGRLAEQLTKLKALDIPARFKEDNERREEEIGYCETVIARWNKARTVTLPTPPAGLPPITCDFETESPLPLEEPRTYTRNGGPVLRVINGGKKS